MSCIYIVHFGHNGKTFSADDLRNLDLWVKADLAEPQDLNREAKSKPIACVRDIQHMLEALWQFESIAGIKSIDDMFLITLL